MSSYVYHIYNTIEDDLYVMWKDMIGDMWIMWGPQCMESR